MNALDNAKRIVELREKLHDPNEDMCAKEWFELNRLESDTEIAKLFLEAVEIIKKRNDVGLWKFDLLVEEFLRRLEQ